MKRIIIIAVTLFFGISGYCQEHMKFMGIEMNVKTSKFVRMLKQEGFGIYYREGGSYIMEGDFARYDSDIFIYSNNHKMVYKTVAVIDSYSWGYCKNIYDELLTNLKVKYGDPAVTTNEFLPPYEEGNGRELTALKAGNVHWHSLWVTDAGRILLSINYSSVKGLPIVGLSYEDKQNSLDVPGVIDDL